MGDGRPEFACNHRATELSTLCLACARETRGDRDFWRMETVKLQSEVDKLKLQLAEEKKLSQGYYDEAAKGWLKFRDAERLNDELKKTICAGICGVDFPGFAVGEHMLRCPFRTTCQRPHTPTSSPALYADGIRSIQCGNCEIQVPLLPPATEKRKCECVWLDGGVVGEYRDPAKKCPVHDKRDHAMSCQCGDVTHCEVCGRRAQGLR